MPDPPFVRVQAWWKAEDGTVAKVDFRGRLLVEQDHFEVSASLPDYSDGIKRAYLRLGDRRLDVGMTQTNWKFRRGKPEGFDDGTL